MRLPLLLLLHLVSALSLMGCTIGSKTLAVAPALTDEFQQSLWPTPHKEVDYSLHGNLTLQDTSIPLQGRVYRSVDNKLTIALFTSFGSSVLEARIGANEVKIINISPIAKKHDLIGSFLVHSIQAVYLSPTDCMAQMNPNAPLNATLHCTHFSGKERFYGLSMRENNNYHLVDQSFDGSITVDYKNLGSSPSFIAQQKRYGFSLSLTHSPSN